MIGTLAIDQGKDIVEVIPDFPFPARGLVKAVLQLVQLGGTISGAHPELVGFAKDIIGWVDGVKISFADVESRKFTKTTWKNLAKIRYLYLLLGTEYLLQDRSIIVISGGLDAILQKLSVLLKSFDRISHTLKDIRNTQEEHHVSDGAISIAYSILNSFLQKVIIDELRDQQETHNRRKFLKTSLRSQTADKIPCDEDTRMEVLADIRAWVNDVSYGSKNFLWLTGDPGCGKSAVTASIARECKDRKILWAQFFINRNNDETTNPNSYFPTIARQLAEHSDVVERRIFDTLSQKSSLLDGISCEQVTRLFVDALVAAASIDKKAPIVVVIDGLDETRRDKLEETATIISTLFDALTSHPNIKVFISSRTEHGIQRPFSKAMRDECVKNIHLDTTSESSIRDDEIYLRKRFTRIAEKYSYDPNIWPGEDRLRFLAFHASGHFIWAVTVTKFLEEQMERVGS
ncbi:hypothetical protein C0995_010269 [Termitomyces sp. Mi166|nr:hypothetical protein C0995_010269 [Termitomyces sp. Mi166\